MWCSNRGFTVCHVYGHGNNKSTTLFWSIQKDKVGMINNSTPINAISCTAKVMRREIVKLHKSHRHQSWMPRDVSRSRNTFLSVSVSPCQCLVSVSDLESLGKWSWKNFGFETAFRSLIRKQQWCLPDVFKVKHCA